MATQRIDAGAAARTELAAVDPAPAHRSPPLLSAKLTAAPQPDAVLPRTRLFERLDAGVAGPLTLVSAGAGWGKTVLLSSWYHARTRGRSGRPAAPNTLGWLSVERGDSGERLWSYLYAALHHGPDGSQPGTGSPVPEGASPARATGPAPGYGLDHLAEDLARRAEPITLILDDLHLVDGPEVADGLEFLLRHAAGRLRLVVGCRTDPGLALRRRRLSGELTEIRATELAFRADELAGLLAAHGVGLAAEQAGTLLARTEGWPAGLRFAALALSDHPDPERFVAEFTGDHPEVADYLAEEVLAGLPAAAREALCRASVVDRFSPDLLDALTGGTDSDRLLAELDCRAGFVIPLDTRPPAYRCHWMLAELLRAELTRRPPDEVADLHRRAAIWSARNDLPAEALRHALAAGDRAHATRLLLGHWPDLLPYGQPGWARPAVAVSPPQRVVDDPELALACASERLDGRDPVAAIRYLDLAASAEERLDGAGGDQLRWIGTALRLAAAAEVGNDAAAQAGATGLLTSAQSADSAPHPDDVAGERPGVGPGGSAGDAGSGQPVRARAAALTLRGAARLGAGDLTAESDLADGMAEATGVGLTRTVRICQGRLALVHAFRGELTTAERLARQALGAAPFGGRTRPADGLHAHLAQALVALHRDRRTDAERYLTLVIEAAGPEPEPVVAALGGLVRAELLRDRGELAGARQAVAAGRRHLGDWPAGGAVRHCLLAVEADLRAAHGDIDGARDLLLAALADGRAPAEPLAVALSRTQLRAGEHRTAAGSLPDWTSPAADDWLLPVRLAAGLLDATVARRGGDHRRAALCLERVLRLAEPEGFRRIFTRADPPVRDLLAAHLDSGTAYWPLLTDLLNADDPPAGPDPGGPPVLGEPLTERELTVLRYLQSILSNVEIAAEMSLSVNTIKTHVRNIYRKLDVTRRRDAVRRARELNLL